MTLTDQQRREAVLRVASLKCPTCNGDTVVERIDSRTGEPFEITCPACNGTSARLPGLRIKCEGRWVSDLSIIPGEPGPSRFRLCSAPHFCPDCQGRGWNPIKWRNERELRLAVAADGLRVARGHLVHINPNYAHQFQVLKYRSGAPGGWALVGEGNELIDAVAQAYELEGEEPS